MDNEQDIKKELTEWLGFEPPRVCGIRIVVALYAPKELSEFVDENGVKKAIALSTESAVLESHLSVSGRVIGIGSDAYVGDCFSNSGPYCKIGDYIAFDGKEGTRLKYRGTSIRIIEDHKCLMPIEDPSYVTRD